MASCHVMLVRIGVGAINHHWKIISPIWKWIYIPAWQIVWKDQAKTATFTFSIIQQQNVRGGKC